VSTLIDERTAWNLVRAVTPGLIGKEPPARLHHDPRPDVWLQVQASGQWEASASVTAEAQDLLEMFLPLQLQDDLVIAQTGQSLDGCIATAGGHSHYVTGPSDIRRLHRLRAVVDAVVVGAGTIASDDPRLTVREVDGANPVRVVLDPDARLDQTKHVFSDGSARTLVFHRAPADSDLVQFSANDVVEIPATRQNGFDGFDPGMVLQVLRDQGLRRILIEGGGITVSRFLQAGVIDRLHVTVAPLLIGSGRRALTLDPIESLHQAIRPPCRHFRLGEDILFDLDLR